MNKLHNLKFIPDIIVFGDADNKSQISTTLSVTGIQSGVVSELQAVIEK